MNDIFSVCNLICKLKIACPAFAGEFEHYSMQSILSLFLSCRAFESSVAAETGPPASGGRSIDWLTTDPPFTRQAPHGAAC